MKREVDVLNAVPSKRIYRSIIADYGLETAIAELIDNVLDSRKRNQLRRQTKVKLRFDLEDQSITIADDAGGIAEADLSKLISPGASLDAGEGSTIGVFGVGSKRAVVALAKDIKIASRCGNAGRTLELDYDDSWLSSEDWDLPYYQVDSLSEGTTMITLSRLRFRIEEADVTALAKYLGCIYGRFIDKRQLQISIS
jgi:hypothetical protein